MQCIFLMSSMNLILFHLFSFDLIPAFSNRTSIIRPKISAYFLITSNLVLLQNRKVRKPYRAKLGSPQHKLFIDLFDQNYFSGQRTRNYFVTYKFWSNFFCKNLLQELLFSREKKNERGRIWALILLIRSLPMQTILWLIKEYLSSYCPHGQSKAFSVANVKSEAGQRPRRH